MEKCCIEQEALSHVDKKTIVLLYDIKHFLQIIILRLDFQQPVTVQQFSDTTISLNLWELGQLLS